MCERYRISACPRYREIRKWKLVSCIRFGTVRYFDQTMAEVTKMQNKRNSRCGYVMPQPRARTRILHEGEYQRGQRFFFSLESKIYYYFKEHLQLEFRLVGTKPLWQKNTLYIFRKNVQPGSNRCPLPPYISPEQSENELFNGHSFVVIDFVCEVKRPGFVDLRWAVFKFLLPHSSRRLLQWDLSWW